MRIDVTCVDLTSQGRVAGVQLTCTVKVAPRVVRPAPVPRAEVGTSGAVPSPPVDDDPDRPEQLVVLEHEAVLLTAPTQQSDAEGAASFEIGLAGTYRRLAARHERDDDFADVAAFLRIRGRVDGLDRTSPFLLTTTSVQDPSGDVDVERVVIVDLAKAIVGHTTEDSCRLWFQLHGTQLADRRYECIVDTGRPSGDGTRRVAVDFDERFARTTTVDLTGLEPGRAYTFRLVSRPPSDPGADRLLCQGSFRTAPADEQALTVLFGSCFNPLDIGESEPGRDFVHWRRLADRADGDVLLLLGDQIYGDAIPTPEVETVAGWYEGYVQRYDRFWAFQPVRQAFARRATYMIPDDHDIKDDWGVFEIPEERLAAGKKAFRTYQLASSPSGRDGDFHYHFRRGPVAFFMMDVRSARGTDDEFPVFGSAQWSDFVAWARSDEVRTADIVVFASGLPLSLLPIDDLRRAFQDELQVTGILAGAAVGSVFGGLGGAITGAGIGAAGAAIVYEELESSKLETTDFREMWTLSSNQDDLVRVLNVLFNLANDIDFDNPDAGPGPHPRAVFALGGDSHMGLVHLLASNRTAPDHRTNPQMFHLTSSAIGRLPQDSDILRLLFREIDEDAKDYSAVVDRLTQDFADLSTRFVLDGDRDEHYRAEALGALFERNFGRLRVERVGAGRRYKVEASIVGETRNLDHVLEIDLDRRPVQWRTYDDNLGISPDVISFGGVRTGEVATRTLTIENFTGQDLEVTVGAPPPGPISWTSFQDTIPHRSSRRITCRFQSTGRIVNSTMVIRSDTPASPQRIGLTGKGLGGIPPSDPDDPPLPTNLHISPSAVTFGGVPVGQTETRAVTIENKTGRTVQLTVPGLSSGPITWPAFQGTIANGTQRRITASFRSSGAIHNATMTISSDTPASPQKVPLTGKGPGGFPTPTPE